MSISAVGVGNVNAVNAVNTVNNRREQLKEKRNLSMLAGASGLLILGGSSLPVKNNIAGLILTTVAGFTSLFGTYNFLKANKELNELNKQQNLSIEI